MAKHVGVIEPGADSGNQCGNQARLAAFLKMRRGLELLFLVGTDYAQTQMPADTVNRSHLQSDKTTCRPQTNLEISCQVVEVVNAVPGS